MKKIGEIGKALSVNKKFTNTPAASGWLAVKKNMILLRYGDAHRFALAFNPSVQIKCAMNMEKSLLGDAPTIRQLLYTYQMEQMQVWVMAQLEDLNEFVGQKNKMKTAQIKALASMIIVKADYLKASEILLFFYKLKAGDFGGFYGAVDAQKVGEYLNAFMNWRNQEVDKLQTKLAQEQLERKRKEWQKKGITREEYDLVRAGLQRATSLPPASQQPLTSQHTVGESVPNHSNE